MNDAQESLATAYTRKLATVLPLIREEWPDLESLEESKEDFEKVVGLIAKHTDRTKAAVRRQLGELVAIAEAGTNGVHERVRPPEPRKGRADQIDEVLSAIRRLESFATEEAKRVSDKVLPIAETKVRQNLWISIIFTFGLGLIFGLWMNRGRRRG